MRYPVTRMRYKHNTSKCVKFVHVTDLHLEVHPTNLDKMARLLDGCDASIFLVGGDNGGPRGIDRIVSALHRLNPSALVAWIKGNHDLWHRSVTELWSEEQIGAATYLETRNLETPQCTVVGTYGHYDYAGGDASIPLGVYERYEHKGMTWNDRFIDRMGRKDQEIAKEIAMQFEARYHDAEIRGLPIVVLMHTYPFVPLDDSRRNFCSAYCINSLIGEVLHSASLKPVAIFCGHTHQASQWSPFGYPIMNPGSDYRIVRIGTWTLDLE